MLGSARQCSAVLDMRKADKLDNRSSLYEAKLAKGGEDQQRSERRPLPLLGCYPRLHHTRQQVLRPADASGSLIDATRDQASYIL
jgi:hypothetical protein